MQADFVRSKSFLMAPAKPTMERRQGAKLHLQEGLQRGISLSHQNLGNLQSPKHSEIHFWGGSCRFGLVFFLFCFVFNYTTLIFLKQLFIEISFPCHKPHSF